MACNKRFTTKERVESEIRLMVLKNDDTRQPYNRSKVMLGIQRACYKRPLYDEAVNQVVDEVEDRLFREFEREVPSKEIGRIVCEVLRKVDQIAYVRYASVYRQFQDLGELIDEAQVEMDRQKTDTPGQGELFG